MRYDVYLAGSLRDERVAKVTAELEEAGLSVFSDWLAAGPEADDYWKKYYRGRGLTYRQALQMPASQSVFNFDRTHMLESKAMCLVLPAGKSGHLELGWYMGHTGRPGYILLDDDPERWDVMYLFATDVLESTEELKERLED